MWASILKALWEVLADVFVGLLDREDIVSDESEPLLETMGDDVSDVDMLRRAGGLLDED